MTLTTKENGRVELRRVYDREERFFGQVLVKFEGVKSPLRITLQEWEEMVVTWKEEQQKKK